jgi:hypothetical protein
MTVSAWHLRALYEDWFAMRLDGRPVLTLIAFGYLRREATRLAQGACLSVVAAYSATQDDMIKNGTTTSLISIIVSLSLMGLAIFIPILSMLDWRDRGRVIELIADGKNGTSAKEVT